LSLFELILIIILAVIAWNIKNGFTNIEKALNKKENKENLD